jgi:hypothetical protein
MGQFPGVGEDSGVLVASTVQFAQTAAEAQRDLALVETNGYINCANAAHTASENAIIGQNGGQASFGPQHMLDAARIGLDPRESSVDEQQETLTIGPATTVADALNAFIVVGRTELTLEVSSIGRGAGNDRPGASSWSCAFRRQGRLGHNDGAAARWRPTSAGHRLPAAHIYDLCWRFGDGVLDQAWTGLGGGAG